MELLFKDEVYAIVGAAIEVHRELKNGFLEAIYQEAMGIEMTTRNIPFLAQTPIQVFYKSRPLVKGYVADFFCYEKILVEIKVMERLTSKETAQLLNYMHATKTRVGVLINFGDAGRLDWERFIL
jgi:GxxExxY protein